jgi:hypothetical protein
MLIVVRKGHLMDDLKSLSNILFFVVMSIIAILSYLQARKTLFSPIKTEIFKLQISAFQEVISFFNKQNQHDFDETFGMNVTFEFNVERMQVTYINTFFPGELELAGGVGESFLNSPCQFIVTEDEIEELGKRSIHGCPADIEKHQHCEIVDPALKLANWNEYKLIGVQYGEKFQSNVDLLKKIAASPVLPRELTDLIYKFIGELTDNLSLVKDVIESAAQEMPIKYPTVDEILNFRSDWIWNRFNSQRVNIEDTASAILKFVNNYLKINQIMR